MGRPSPGYTPKAAAHGVLHQVVRDHFETFRAEAARVYERDALPRFIEEEFRGFLRCGFLAGGFARFHCGRCGLDRLVPFSCKGRAVCPSCGGRRMPPQRAHSARWGPRMAERAAHLVDDVFPVVPVRQWVLSLPHRLRYVLAWDHALCRYALRPPIAADRLHLTADGQVVLDLRHRWADGTTRLLFEPVELLERLAALTPRPRINLLPYIRRAGRAIGVAVTPAGARARHTDHRRPVHD